MEFCLAKVNPFKIKKDSDSKDNGKNILDNAKITLEDLTKGQEYTIYKVPENPLLESLGFRPGKKVTLKARECFKGPMVCSVEGRNVAISRDIAKEIILH
ncbi:FeoA family protein [Natranaerofaba carboxydovora]|uniref:FeoA family protein n=1 Tax=Natranaerofaba carboxydovora TaxID=2742683 RepID=UPI001F141CDC|nr:FeoA family protein [Natranaerofaba carboxydovora]UMZ72938.1 FeoA domain protein [Natranaerofaba carboxydovora]